LVFPLDAVQSTQSKIEFGAVENPYLESINAILYSAKYSEKTRSLECVVSSFQGHAVTAKIVGTKKATMIVVDGEPVKNVLRSRNNDGSETLEVDFSGSETKQHLSIIY
jgi:hypothetical protein